jgi:hypothetical protein
MVTEALLWALGRVFSSVMRVFPTWQWPESFPVVNSNSWQGVGLPVGAVLDVTLATSVIVAVLGAFVVAAGIKAVRMAISHFTGGGGAT